MTGRGFGLTPLYISNNNNKISLENYCARKSVLTWKPISMPNPHLIKLIVERHCLVLMRVMKGMRGMRSGQLCQRTDHSLKGDTIKFLVISIAQNRYGLANRQHWEIEREREHKTRDGREQCQSRDTPLTQTALTNRGLTLFEFITYIVFDPQWKQKNPNIFLKQIRLALLLHNILEALLG